MSHTPGPWFHDGEGRIRSTAIEGRTVAIIHHAAGNASIQKENAVLIAAAPTMKDLLIEALPYVEESEKFNGENKKKLSKKITDLIELIEGE